MQTGTILSGAGHAALILWVILGDWLFASRPNPPVQVTEVSLMTSAEFDAMAAAAPSIPEPAPASEAEAEPEPAPQPPSEPITAPEPVAPVPEPEPLPEDLPENNGAPDAEALPVSPDFVPEVPLPLTESPRPRPAPRVAPAPVDAPEPEAEVAEAPQEAVSPEPAAEPEVIEEERPVTAEEEAGTVLETEANRDEEVVASGAPPTSPRPRGRPVRSEAPPDVAAAPTAPETPDDPAEPALDPVADAIAGALSELASETTATNAPIGPPLTSGETDAFRVSVQRCWNVGSLSTEAMRTTVVVFVSVAQDGVPDAGSIRMVDFSGGTDAAANQAYEAARRAIIRCGASGFPLPADKFDQWREMELVFNPDGMRLR